MFDLLESETRADDSSQATASSTLAVQNEEGLEPERAAYASDSLRDRFTAMRPEVRCSSALEPAANAVDNRVWTRWLCTEADADPWIEIDPGRPLEVARLQLTHARTTGAESRRANPRPARVELWL